MGDRGPRRRDRPLDKFTDLDLHEKTDRYLYTRTTTRQLNNNKK